MSDDEGKKGSAHESDIDRDSNWEDASQFSQDNDVISVEDEELQKLEEEIFAGEDDAPLPGGHPDDEDEETKEPEHKAYEASPLAVKIFKKHTDAVYRVAVNPIYKTQFASAGGDDVGMLWDLDSLEPKFVLKDHKDTIEHVAFNFEGKRLATGSMDNTVKIWDVATGELKKTLDGPGGEITFIDWHPKGNVLLAGSQDGTLWMWNANSGDFLGLYQGHTMPVTGGAFTLDGKKIVSISEDASVRIWNPRTAETMHKIMGHGFHTEGVLCMDLSTKHDMVVTGGADKTICISNLSTGRPLTQSPGQEASVECVRFSDMFDVVALGTLDGTVTVYDNNKMLMKERIKTAGGITNIVFNESRKLFINTNTEGDVAFFDYRDSSSLVIQRLHSECIYDLKFFNDNEFITSSEDKTIGFFDLRTCLKQSFESMFFLFSAIFCKKKYIDQDLGFCVYFIQKEFVWCVQQQKISRVYLFSTIFTELINTKHQSRGEGKWRLLVVSPFFETVFFSFIEQIRLCTSQIDDLWAAVSLH
eukprot:TRINITY_DN2221_c0_g1_i6.p1 TRINITY_DN2221_c0_g1~~TRINITY_DN2221_c0_g1_i6.p1  ORF type:complete len:530 (-),score=81.21 TRINITY_DN2221_c0_g1_i6:501-2090(-)